MPEPTTVLTQLELLRAALIASGQLTSHTHQVFGGWEECKPCEKANDECDGSLACDQYKQWKKQINAGLRSHPTDDEAITQELRIHLRIAERQNAELDAEVQRLRQEIAVYRALRLSGGTAA